MKRQPTPQHVTWFLDLYKNGQLELSPPYQRKSVWTPKDRRFFIDTIFRNYPAPPIFIHRELSDDGTTRYYVVDGKQRLETIFMFNENKIAIDKNFGDNNLDGKRLQDLSTEYKRRFWDYVLVVDFIENIEGTSIESVFDRVNRNSKNLQPQELRHARFDGWFIKEAEEESDNPFWWDIKISTKAKDRRMKNVQFISELLLVLLENKIVGFDQDHLDEMYARYDELEEIEDIFDLDSYKEKKIYLKKLLAEMEAVNYCVSTYAKTGTHMYILWSFLALSPTSLSTIELAEKYKAFMKTVEIIEEARKEGLELNEIDQDCILYYNNSKGAATEYPQREQRLKALTDYMLK